MKRGAWLLIFGLACTTVLGGPPDEAAVDRESRQWMETVRGGGTLRVENPYGDVYARFGGYEGQVEILATIQHLDPVPHLEVERDEVDSGLRVRVRPGSDEGGGSSATRNRVDLVVFVPQGARLDVETREGKIEAKGLRSDLIASSIGGDIRIRGIEGHVQAKSTRGRLSATLLSAVTDLGQALATETGEIEVYLWEDADLDVRIATSGEITTDFSIEIEHRRHEEPGKHATATVGDGGPALTLSSKRGDIRLLRLQKQP
jgi:hypothetical protein